MCVLFVYVQLCENVLMYCMYLCTPMYIHVHAVCIVKVHMFWYHLVVDYHI